MTNQSTIDKLLEMRLTSMSDAYITQISDPKMKDISFEDRFALLVDIEYNNRKSNGLKRLIRNAGFDQPEAYISDINYASGRKLNRNLIERLAYYRVPEYFYYRRYRKRKNIYGLCLWHGSLQAAVQNQICTAPGSVIGTGYGPFRRNL